MAPDYLNGIIRVSSANQAASHEYQVCTAFGALPGSMFSYTQIIIRIKQYGQKFFTGNFRPVQLFY